MINSKKLIFALALACVCLSVFAKDAEVSLLVKVTVNQKIDPFYARTFGGDPQVPDLVFPDTLWGQVGAKNAGRMCAKPGEYFFVYCTYPKKAGRVAINGFHYLPYGIFEAYLTLPFAKEITVPEDARYAYVGSLEYDIDPKTFKVLSVKIHDDFDAAQAAANKITGKKIKLVRATLQDRKAQ
jgi:hypothetical protein